jgi:hypothetical protein
MGLRNENEPYFKSSKNSCVLFSFFITAVASICCLTPILPPLTVVTPLALESRKGIIRWTPSGYTTSNKPIMRPLGPPPVLTLPPAWQRSYPAPPWALKLKVRIFPAPGVRTCHPLLGPLLFTRGNEAEFYRNGCIFIEYLRHVLRNEW